MLDFHLAELYGVETRALKQAVRRNPERFPADFMFELTPEETRLLVSQTVISSSHGGSRYGQQILFSASGKRGVNALGECGRIGVVAGADNDSCMSPFPGSP